MADPNQDFTLPERPDPFKGYKPFQAIFERNPFALLGPPLEAGSNFAGDVITEVLTGEPRNKGEPTKVPPAAKKVAEDAAALILPGAGLKAGVITFEGNVPFTHRQGNREGAGSGEEQRLATEREELKAKLRADLDRLLRERAAQAASGALGPDGLPLRFPSTRVLNQVNDIGQAVAGGTLLSTGYLARGGFVVPLISDTKDRVYYGPPILLPPITLGKPVDPLPDALIGAAFSEITNDAPSLLARSNAEEGSGGGVPGLLVTADP